MKNKNARGVELYASDEEVESVLRRFEACEFAPDDFKHRHHLDVALIYLLRHPAREAHERMRASLLKFLEGHGLGTSVYHETITAFWMKRVLAFVEGTDRGRPLHELANDLAYECADPSLIFDYYSRELINSAEARAGWVEPDLKNLDF